jgi:cardiolipin synthase
MNHVTTIAMVLGYVTVAILAFIGFLDAVRDTPVKRVQAPAAGDAEASPPAVGEPLFRETVELLSRTALAPGHQVEVFTSGDETYPRLWEDLRGAKQSITMQMYYCKPGRMADTLAEILSERARAGVRVFVLYDSFGTSLKKKYLKRLREAGVSTAAFRPFSLPTINKLKHRAHIRVVVIDGTVGYTGGFGIHDKWFGNGRRKDEWRDTNARFTGPAVRQLQATFAACWAEATKTLLTGAFLYPEPPANGDGVLAGVLHASPSVGSTEAERLFALSIAGARRTLYITNSYFVPDKDLRGMLMDAARRGVDTRVLTVGPETDIKSTLYAGRARYEELLAAGIRIYEYAPTMMHAKTIVVDDGWASVGSMNADNRSLSFNEESNLLVLDQPFARRLTAIFQADLEHSREIDLEQFRRRPIHQKALELAAHAIWRVL